MTQGHRLRTCRCQNEVNNAAQDRRPAVHSPRNHSADSYPKYTEDAHLCFYSKYAEGAHSSSYSKYAEDARSCSYSKYAEDAHS